MQLLFTSLIGCIFVVCVTGLVTVPSVENGGTVTVARLENTTNVTIFCELTNGAGDMVIGSNWVHVDPKANPMRDLVTNIPLFDRGSFPFANLTITSFLRSLDETTLECSNLENPGLQEAFFLLRVIRKLHWSMSYYIGV